MNNTATEAYKIQKIQYELRPRPVLTTSNIDPVSNLKNFEFTETQKNKTALPIPKGETPYALAKIAEYKERNLDKAEYFYRLAIEQGERRASAVKDLASLMHQRGKTKEACEFLLRNRKLFRSDQEKFENLYKTLEKQINLSANSQNKTIKISNLPKNMSESNIKALFENSIRIKTVNFESEQSRKELNYYCIIHFNSHSSARKTLEGFNYWDRYKVEWVNSDGEVVGDAHYYRQKMQEYRREHPTFDYQVFDRDPSGYLYCLPVESSPLVIMRKNSEQENCAKELIGSTLFSMIFSENNIECR